jgi:hypothetical protein
MVTPNYVVAAPYGRTGASRGEVTSREDWPVRTQNEGT